MPSGTDPTIAFSLSLCHSGFQINEINIFFCTYVFFLNVFFFPPPQFTQCLAELKELLQQEIHKKFNQLGQDVDLEGNWSDISLSDIESR